MRSTTLLPFLPALAAAIAAPAISGYNLAWSETFAGTAGATPDTAVWDIMDSIDTNQEVQDYTSDSRNLQISGGGTVQFIPRRATGGKWTSGRIETKDSWMATAGKSMIIQASIGLGTNAASNKQGLWPAFWTLGDAVRHGTGWPMCGELDIMEQVNGVMTGYGTAHCGPDETGGPCNEYTGAQKSVAIPDDGFHTWALKIDRTNLDWTQQTIQWILDGSVFYTLTGSDINDLGIWATIAHSPLYVLMNVAVGGSWPGDPNDETEDGFGSMMEVQYVAVYQST
ncbi:glycoside hydrolase family 16 protein [Pseudomassariella vexata]|uniref:Glycoside hydrolase family 16 protein n=1 Tax=Pseudomassariella vexata TaxID=1141098 RepID=A0A1Y2D6Q3_9PEZI|nr:glycoside hydrolase family 16 protein [Pseudomassariella vexata]ORY54969.1 glycoside hydrolase family 16 protein [Pseudomassariella vexata]